MAYIPKDAEWFLAQLVEEFRVKGHKQNVIHINCVLIQANSPDEAYRKAIELGEMQNNKWINPEGEEVTHRFLGLRNLDVIHDPLEDGCELMYFERLGISKKALGKIIRPKYELEAFQPIRRSQSGPDYTSKKVMDMLNEKMGKVQLADARCR